MPFPELTWGHFVLGVFTALLAVWILAARRAKPGLMGLILGFAHLLIAAAGSAAPIRQAIDPGDAGYAFGVLSAAHGLQSLLISGAVWVAAVMGAFAALDASRGASAIAFATSAVFTLVLGIPVVESLSSGLSLGSLQIGPGVYAPTVETALVDMVLLLLPFGVGVVWAGGRAFER